jgi:hypothetical protein
VVPERWVHRNLRRVEHGLNRLRIILDVAQDLGLGPIPDIMWRLIPSPYDKVKISRFQVLQSGMECRGW